MQSWENVIQDNQELKQEMHATFKKSSKRFEVLYLETSRRTKTGSENGSMMGLAIDKEGGANLDCSNLEKED